MKKTVLAVALASAFAANTAVAEEATMTPDVITQSAAGSSAPANGLVFGLLLVGLVATIASGGNSSIGLGPAGSA